MRLAAMVALGAVAYAVFLVVTAPANFIAARVSAAAPGRIELSGTHGTLWHGTARGRVLAPGGHVLLERIEWRLLPARLLSGRVAFDVSAAARGIDGHAEVGRGFTRWELRDVAVRGEAAALTPLLPLIAAWRPEGSLSLSAPALAWDEHEARGDLRLEWKDAAISISDVRPLGSYRVEAHAQGGPAQLTLTTLGGPLKLSAQGTFTPPSRLSLSGDARAEGPEAKALEPLLDLLGPRRPDGARALELRVN
jgi:general secretion pathway protein N